MHGVNNWYMVFTCHYYQSSLFSKCDLQPVIKCLWSIVISVCGYLCGCITVWFHWNYSLWVQFHLDVHIDVHKFCLLHNLRLLIVHSFSVPSLAVNGRVRRTPKGTPTVVRRGQTDWVHRLLCGLPGVHRGPGTLLPGTPLIAGQRAPHRAVLPVEWMDVLRPRWDGVLIGVMMLWSRGTTLLIGA